MRLVPIGNPPKVGADVSTIDTYIAKVALGCCDKRSSVNMADQAAINGHVCSCGGCLQIIAEYMFIHSLKFPPDDEYQIIGISMWDSLELMALQMYQRTYAPHFVNESWAPK